MTKKKKFQVVVGDKTLFDGDDFWLAQNKFEYYCATSRDGFGQGHGQSVRLFEDGKAHYEFLGSDSFLPPACGMVV
jgi:hypothetical protein